MPCNVEVKFEKAKFFSYQRQHKKYYLNKWEYCKYNIGIVYSNQNLLAHNLSFTKHDSDIIIDFYEKTLLNSKQL